MDLEDGLYLSTYLSPPGIARLLSVWPRHDNNMSLWRKNGNRLSLERHWELERHSGLKQHGAAFLSADEALSFIDSLLRREGVSASEICEIWGTPGLDTTCDYGQRSAGVPQHGISHLFSALMMDWREFYEGKILGLSVDGVPDFMLERTEPYYAGVYSEAAACRFFPIESPGRIYDSARETFARRAGTLMALATASKACVPDDPEELLTELEFWGKSQPCFGRVGAVEAADVLLERAMRHVRFHLTSNKRSCTSDPRFSDEENFVSMVMKLLQRACLHIMERTIERAMERFSMTPSETSLALSGGFGLNLPSNTHLLRKYGFKQLLIPPCTNDSGQSIGIALATFFFRSSGQKLEFEFPGAFIGAEATDDEVAEALARNEDAVTSVKDFSPEQFVADVRNAPVLWFDGASEAGPRALGHRSILGDPTQHRTKQELNRIKQREWWRPVAPIVLRDNAPEWFEGPIDSQYMLFNFVVRTGRASRIPAVVHLDGTARVQTLTEKQNPRLFRAISAFRTATEIPMLCNTSLNGKGEPIVNSVDEAIAFARSKALPVGYLHGKRVEFRTQEHSGPPLERTIQPFGPLSRSRFEGLQASIDPHGLGPVRLYLYLTNPALQMGTGLLDADAAREFATRADAYLAQTPGERVKIEKYLAHVWTHHHPPCEDFANHPWSNLFKFSAGELAEARSY